MIAISGASGNTGSVIARTLLARGGKVRVIGRDANRLASLVQKGAEAAVADVTDAEALARAFQGAQAVYVLIPPNMSAEDVRGFQERVSDAAASAINKASVSHAVVLSSIGADKPAGTGPVVGLHSLEEKLNGIAGLNAVHLRAGYFMENVLPQVDVIRNFGMMGGPVRPDLRLSVIATRDISDVAADLLLKLDFSGKQSRELLGERDLDYREITSIVGKAIGKPQLAYVLLPPPQLKPVLMQMGMSSSMADLLLQMAEALNTGYMTALEARSASNTTRTSMEAFVAEEFFPRFQAKAAGAGGA
jgi:uncharacterized protein YbjT (DUF2867 family)